MDSPVYPVPSHFMGDRNRQPHIVSISEYRRLWKESIEDPDTFFGNQARGLLSWTRPFTTVVQGSFGNVSWFTDGCLNACYNCVDRHAAMDPNKVAFIYEPDDPRDRNEKNHFTYTSALKEICQLANTLLSFGLRKGDTVAIYMPNIPHTCLAMLACARLGLVHNVIFAGFSADSLRDRLIDSKCSVLITADEGMRAGKIMHLKRIVDEALNHNTSVTKVLVFRRTGSMNVPMTTGRDVWWQNIVPSQKTDCPCESMSAEDVLFILYTSGSTGKPKGIVHTTAGYLLGAALSSKYVFDLERDDVFACMADCGWITGHTYCVFGPLLLGATSVIFESIPTYPTPSRYWDLVDCYRVTALYTSPTVVRALRRLGDNHLHKHDLKSLRILGSVGEPINPDAWEWYYRIVGKKRVPIVDTYWQTETGSHVITPIPGVIPTKPGSATLPFFGIDPVIVDPITGNEINGPNATGVLCFRQPWPSMARTIFGDHKRYMATYFTPFKGLYFTGDSASRDKDGYVWIRGRVDDVINVSGHRLSTAEIESALVSHETCAEAAVIASPDEITGQAIVAFVILRNISTPIADIPALLSHHVRKVIGPIATPKLVLVVPDLPKTRSGKIMRRVLRKVHARETDSIGDTSTLADPSIVQVLMDLFQTDQHSIQKSAKL